MKNLKPETGNLKAGPIHVKSGPLNGFSFRDQETAQLAERLLWSHLPNTIVITGPAASGKTHLAKLVMLSNNCLAEVYTGKVGAQELGRLRSTGMSAIFDNIKARQVGHDLDYFMTAGAFIERKLGTHRTRINKSRPPLIIITTNDDAAIANLQGEFYLIALEERPGAWKKRSKKSGGAK